MEFVLWVSLQILRSCKEILPVESHEKTFEKIYSYYFKKGEEKWVLYSVYDNDFDILWIDISGSVNLLRMTFDISNSSN